MLEIVSKNNNLYNVLDTEDGIIESCSFLDIISVMKLGVDIKGVSFVNDEYDGTSNGSESYDDFASMPNQVSNAENGYFTDQYKLDKIIVCV